MARPLGRSYQQNLHLTFNLMQNNMTVTLSSAGKRTFWHQIFLCQWPNWERNFYQVLSNTWDVSHYMTDPLHGSKYIIYHNVIINLSNQQELIILWWKAQTILANIRLSYPRQEILVVLYNRSDSMSLLLGRVNKYKDLWVTVGRWLENEQINNPDSELQLKGSVLDLSPTISETRTGRLVFPQVDFVSHILLLRTGLHDYSKKTEFNHVPFMMLTFWSTRFTQCIQKSTGWDLIPDL